MSRRYDCVIFDLDGTVMDTSEGVIRSVQYALRGMGLPDDDMERIRRFIGPPLHQAFTEYYEMNDADATEAVRLYRVRYADVGVLEYTPYPGMPELIREIKAAGMKVGIATGKPEKFTRVILRDAGLDGCVDKLVTPNLSDKRQDKPAMVRAILEACGGNAVMVGDRKFAIEGAVANGIDSIGVLQGFGSRQELEESGATFIVQGAQDIRRILGLTQARGRFITFEGTDGTGKSTQIERLRAALAAQGREVVVTREPGGNPIAERIRGLLLDRSSVMDDVTEAYLYAAARAEHVRTVILPALERGADVLCDRYIDSSVAYQGYGRELGAERVLSINAEAVAGCLPDRTYLLTLPQQEAQARIAGRGERDRMESAGEAFDRRVAEGFLRIAEKEPERMVVLDARRSVEELARCIAQDVAKLKTSEGARR